ncbi:flagellar hook-associated protein FlgL [Effusibacillus pohliae]|uniref:flagellar hook-associated protein FlgL n=1 Tax=Effusibacillus pohliae TaxID=232270 RepID=UPI0003639B1D|nr:flagellar hook-associated protein FlgL [Effusibacillus pohliae]
MRITQSMLNNQFLLNLRASNERMQQYQDMMATGKRVNKPADDPVSVSYAMRYKSQIANNEQYKRNLDRARSMLDATDDAISKVNALMQRVRELAVQGASDTATIDAKTAIASEVGQLYEELVNLGNTRFNGKSLFNGQMTDQNPYTLANAKNQNSDPNSILVAVADGVNIPINTTGNQVFGQNVGVEPDNAFAIVQDLQTFLLANNSAAISQLIGRIDSRLSKIQNAWADVGGRANRVDLIRNRTEDTGLNLQKLSSDVEDADMAEVITKFKTQESVYRSALSAGARIIQPSLVDFLR